MTTLLTRREKEGIRRRAISHVYDRIGSGITVYESHADFAIHEIENRDSNSEVTTAVEISEGFAAISVIGPTGEDF